MAKKSEMLTTDKWIDSIGQEFRPGDLIAVAVINGRSPQMVIAEVVKINLTDSKGERHVKTVLTGRKVEVPRDKRTYTGPDLEEVPRFGYAYSSRGARSMTQTEIREAHARNNALRADPDNWLVAPDPYMKDETKEVQSCTVTARPVQDGRGFYRSGTRDGTEAKPVTYRFIGNIVRLPRRISKDDLGGQDRWRDGH